jgi:hypothetical protein
LRTAATERVYVREDDEAMNIQQAILRAFVLGLQEMPGARVSGDEP